jgi:Sortase domain
MAGRRFTGPLAVALIVFGAAAAIAGVAARGGIANGSVPPPGRFPVMDPSVPTRIEIPALKVKAPIHGVGLAGDGSIAVPDLAHHNEAGWFKKSPTPGQYGPAVIVGHADTRTGPSVFHDVAKIKPGTRVEIDRRDGSVAVFEVNSVEKFSKANQPIERIYADFSRPSLRLITCGGEFKGGSIGYVDNIVVFASLVESKEP